MKMNLPRARGRTSVGTRVGGLAPMMSGVIAGAIRTSVVDESGAIDRSGMPSQTTAAGSPNSDSRQGSDDPVTSHASRATIRHLRVTDTTGLPSGSESFITEGARGQSAAYRRPCRIRARSQCRNLSYLLDPVFAELERPCYVRVRGGRFEQPALRRRQRISRDLRWRRRPRWGR